MHSPNAGIGHNKPPRPAAPTETELLAYMRAEYEPTVADYNALIAQEAEVPKVVENDEDSAKITDYVLALAKNAKAFEAARTNEGAPYLTGTRTINNYFKKFTENVEKIKERVDAANQKYLRAKADREKREAAEKAAAEKREAAEKLRIAQKAADDARAEKDRLQKEADKIKADAEKAIADKQKEVDDLKKQGEVDKATIKEKEKELVEVKEVVEEKTREALRPINAAKTAARRGADAALDEAVAQDQVAAKAERKVDEKDSVLSRTRADTGMAAIAKEWVGRVDPKDGRARLDLEKLRHHFSIDDLNRAINAAVRAGERNIKGALITEELKTTYR